MVKSNTRRSGNNHKKDATLGAPALALRVRQHFLQKKGKRMGNTRSSLRKEKFLDRPQRKNLIKGKRAGGNSEIKSGYLWKAFPLEIKGTPSVAGKKDEGEGGRRDRRRACRNSHRRILGNQAFNARKTLRKRGSQRKIGRRPTKKSRGPGRKHMVRRPRAS